MGSSGLDELGEWDDELGMDFDDGDYKVAYKGDRRDTRLRVAQLASGYRA